MNERDIHSIVNQAQQEQQSVTDLAQQTVEWFISSQRVGNAYPIEEATQNLSEHLNTSHSEASRAISSVVGDIVDPVQLITLSDGKYVGVFEYNVYSESGAYGYIHYDDRFGKLKRVVCAKCVQDHILDENVTHATQGLGTASDDASWTDLINKIEHHYDDAHEAHPEDIEPGAALVSGTTISGNTAFHTGNESSITHDNISGGTSGNPHADSLSTSYTAPVQSVNSQTGDVTISTGISGSVTNYSDLPFNLSERQFYYVTSENDVVVQTDADLDIWKSISDFTTVASTIPDSELVHQYDATSISGSDGDSISTWADQAGSADLTAGGSPTLRIDGINNNQILEFDGINEYLDASFSVSQASHVFTVFRFRSISSSNSNLYSGFGDRKFGFWEENSGQFSIYAGSKITVAPSNPTNAHYATALYNGSSSNLRLDGGALANSVDAGTGGADGLTVADSHNQAAAAPVNVGEIIIYDRELSASERDSVESYLSDKWGI